MHWPLGPRGVLNVDDAASLPSLRDRALIGGSTMSRLRTRSIRSTFLPPTSAVVAHFGEAQPQTLGIYRSTRIRRQDEDLGQAMHREHNRRKKTQVPSESSLL
jgi:hypothetical protein